MAITKKSRRTIERKRDKYLSNDTHQEWFKMDERPYKYRYHFLEEFLNMDVIFNNNIDEKTYLNEIRQLKNTILCLSSKKNTLEYQLTHLDWNFFITLAYEFDISSNRCFDACHQLYDVISQYNDNARMFFTTEAFTNRKGYHNHIILKHDMPGDEMKNCLKFLMPKAIIDVQKYNPFLAGVFYVSKEGLRGEDWDILGSDLSGDASK